MASKKTTRSAVVMSFTALLLCASMLIATTFAWFTDSVTSSGNIIKSGTLDIEMYWADGTKAVPATDSADWTDASTGAIFNHDLWEPGYTEVRHIKIKNAGTLALKYQLRLKATGTVSDLTDAIDVYFTDPATQVSDRAMLTDANKIDTLTNVLATIPGQTAGNLNAGQEVFVTLALKMQEEAGNEYQDKAVGSDFAVELLATQMTAETDSFDEKYDTDAEYYDYAVSTTAEFLEAVAKGGKVMLTEDITMDNMLKIAEGTEVTLNMNGKTIDFERNALFIPGNPLFYPLPGSKLTITGNGTVDLGDNFDAALVYPAGEVVIENGTFIRNRVPDGTSPDDVQTLFMGVKSVGASVVIKDGYFDGGYYDKNAELAFSETAADEANRGKAADKNLYRTAIKNNTLLLLNLSWSSAAGTQDFRIYGGTFVGANPAWGDEGCAMPITPDYLRPWSYYQGMFLEGQKMCDDKIEIPDGYTIAESKTADGRPVFTVNYSK